MKPKKPLQNSREYILTVSDKYFINITIRDAKKTDSKIYANPKLFVGILINNLF